MAQVKIQGCFSNLCLGDNTKITGFALIKLITPEGFTGLVHDTQRNVYLPCDQVVRADIDLVTGCFCSCPIPSNDVLNVVAPNGDPLTYYEVAIIINNCCVRKERIILDSRVNTYPAPPACVDLASVTVDSVPATASNLFCNLVSACTTAIPGAVTVINVLDTTTVDMTRTGAGTVLNPIVISSVVKISSLAGNALTSNASGLYVPGGSTVLANGVRTTVSGSGSVASPYIVEANIQPDTPLAVIDTQTVNLTGSGTYNHTLQADVIVSVSAGNKLFSTAGGLFSESTPVTAGTNVTITGAGTVASPYVVNATTQYETPLTAIDTSTIDFTTSGTDSHTLTGVVKVSAIAGNSVIINPDGIYVPSGGAALETPLTVVDTQSVNLTASGTSNHTLQADVIISSVAANKLSNTASGLYSESTFITPGTNATVTGAGTAISPYVISSPNDITTTLVNNGNGTFTYLNELATSVIYKERFEFEIGRPCIIGLPDVPSGLVNVIGVDLATAYVTRQAKHMTGFAWYVEGLPTSSPVVIEILVNQVATGQTFSIPTTGPVSGFGTFATSIALVAGSYVNLSYAQVSGTGARDVFIYVDGTLT